MNDAHQVTTSKVNFKSPKVKKQLRVGLAMFIGPIGWLSAYSGVSATLLPAKIGQLIPAHKVATIALFSTVAMIVATIANIVAGAFSDITRSKHGKRTPWIVTNSILSAILLFAFSMANSVPVLLGIWAVYQITLNAIIAPMVAQIADRISPNLRGTVSSFYGVGYAIGNFGSGIIASRFISHVSTGIIVFAFFTLFGCLLSAWLAQEPSNMDSPKKPFNKQTIKENFMFPTANSRDYYLAVGGKFLMMVGQFIIVGYQLYIFTDYMKLNPGQTATSVAIMSTILLITGILLTALTGPISDHVHRVKFPVAFATILLGVGALFPVFTPSPWTMYAYALISGIGMGAYNAVDQALNIAVLPNPDSAAKDLGFINVAVTVGMIVGPLISGGLISLWGYRIIFPVETLICLIGGIMIMMIKKVK